MTLAVGTRLGSYEVIAPLGAGGMGEVYRARDTRLGREVAIKVLPAERLSDPTRRARLEQEARAVAALSHPSIVTIHGIESAEGMEFIVMELVPGKTLDALIPRHGMRLGEVLHIAIPLADALTSAHAAGIVHRDLKPANVMLTPEGVVKVLDFGLAKLTQAEQPSGEDDATLDAPDKLSRPGTIAGTPAYMSPEQASGGVADARSDIFAFGAVLYEMVTGRRPFGGGSSAEMLASLLKEQPKAPSELAPELPKELERIILHCLRKEPGRRFQHMADVKVELEELKEESDSHVTAGPATAKGRRWRRHAGWAAIGLLVLAAAATLAQWRLRRPKLPPPTVAQLTAERRAGSGSFSPDGTQIAYSSAGEKGDNWDIWLKIVGEAEARRLTTDPAAESTPAWSPDGTQIAFLRHPGLTGRESVTYYDAGAVHLVSPVGGTARRLSDFPARLQLSWSPDGRWLATAKARSGSDPPGGVHLISVTSGEPHAVTFPKPPAFDVCPAFSPDGRTLAYSACEGYEDQPPCDVHVLSLDSDLKPAGAAHRLTHQRLLWHSGIAWTRDGRSIVYAAAGGLWRIPANGRASPELVELAVHGSAPSIAKNRDRLAFVRRDFTPDIHRLEPGGLSTPIVESAFSDFHPQYSPDGRRIAFQSDRAGGGGFEIWLAEADGSNPTRLTRGPGRNQGWPGWSPDGGSIAFDSQAEDGHPDIWTIGVDGSRLRQLTHDSADDMTPSWSRDGRYVYFTSNRTGRNEIWRVRIDGEAEEQLSPEGGALPAESLDGRTLYYRRDDRALVARPTGGGQETAILRCPGKSRREALRFAVAPRGLIHVGCDDPESPGSSLLTLRYWDAATDRDPPVGTIETAWLGGLAVSPDGKSILYGRSRETSALMMIENFR